MTSLVVFDEAEARQLTERIRSSVADLAELIREAYEGQVWRVLGYKSWTEYVDSEFPFTRQHSYRLLDQGVAMHALSEAAGYKVELSSRQAQVVKSAPAMAAVVEDIKAGVSPREAIRKLAPVRYERVRDGSAGEYGDDLGEAVYECRHCHRSGTLATLTNVLRQGYE